MSEEAKPPERKKARSSSSDGAASSSWRQKCIDTFHLQPLPPSFLDKTGALAKLTESDDGTWERYYQYRMKNGPEEAKNDSDDDDDEEESDDENWGESEIRSMVKDSLEAVMDDLLQNEEDEQRKLLINAWKNHASLNIDPTLDGNCEIRSADYGCTTFSPYAIPRAFYLEQAYHYRTRYSSLEFHVTWSFRLLRFDDTTLGKKTVIKVPPGKSLGVILAHLPWLNMSPECEKDSLGKKVKDGDRIVKVNGQDTTKMQHKDLLKLLESANQEVRKLTILSRPRPQAADPTQVALEKHFPRGWTFSYPTVDIYCADNAREILASNGFLTPPHVSSNYEDDVWEAVEIQDVSNLTPATVRRLRGWLYGSPLESMKILNDFDFLRLLFAACGSGEDFSTIKGTIGHVWVDYCSPYREEIGALLVKEDESVNTSWLEYQCRLISGALRPIDRYYEPYDILEAKANWGREVLHMEDERSRRRDEDEEEEDLNEVPWMVWQKKEENAVGDNVVRDLMSALQSGMMGLGRNVAQQRT